jgi:hypothetical protein
MSLVCMSRSGAGVLSRRAIAHSRACGILVSGEEFRQTVEGGSRVSSHLMVSALSLSPGTQKMKKKIIIIIINNNKTK